MKIVSLFSIKGGVGKTAAAVNIAYYAAMRGQRNLLIDLDAQGSAGFYFRVRPSQKAKGRSLLQSQKSIFNLIRESDFDGLDILPASLGIRNIDRHLDKEPHKRKRLNSVFGILGIHYDRIIVDCPPHFGLLSENVFHFSDTILVPVIPSILSERTLRQLYDFFERHNYNKGKIFAFFSMVNISKSLHRQTLESADRERIHFLSTMIPNASEVERMGLTRQPLLAYDTHSKGGKAFSELGMELESLGCL